MKNIFPAGLMRLTLLFLMITWTGCSTSKMVYNKIIPDKEGLKKRVLVLPLIDQADLGETKVREIQALFLEELRKDEHFLITEATFPPSSNKRATSAQLDILVNPNLAKKAESMGMNVLITATFHPIDVNTETKGFWPVLFVQQKVELSMAVNALDLTNGTLFMTNLEATKIKMEKQVEGFEVLQIQGQFEEETDKPLKFVDEKKIKKALVEIVENHASAIKDELKDEPWSGKIVSFDGEKLVINAGRDVGVITGSLFEVFDRGETIQSVNGRSYHLLGPKMGEIKTTRVMENQSSAVPWKGEGFKVGQTIRVKD